MKSAKQKKSVRTTLLLFLTVFSLLTSCVGCSRFSFLSKEDEGTDTESPTDTDANDGIPAITPAEPSPPTYYNRYTGLACDEEILSCRPISVCIGNFDGKRQEGLSLADIIIESPHDGDKTRLLAIYTDHRKTDAIVGVSSIKDYMLSPVNAFGAIAVYAGNGDKKPGEVSTSQGDYLDYSYHNLSSAFEESTDGLRTNIKSLTNASITKGYSLTDPEFPLPYRLAELDTVYTPNSNRIRNISFRYSTANSVSFTYHEDTRVYQKLQNGIPHTDSKTGEQLAFSNLLLLFHNVSYYYSSDQTTFTIDTKTGGDGYLYTGGGVISVRWRYTDDGALSIVDDTGEKITVNRGKTYIGMLKVTDSSTLIAK